MEKNNTLANLGLDQLTKQIKGQDAFVVDAPAPTPPAPEPINTNPTPPDNGNDQDAGDGKDKNILNEPIDISTATARNVDDNTPPAPQGNNDASSPFAPFANVLKEQGVISEEYLKDKKFESVDDFVEIIQKTIEDNVSKYREQFVSEKSPEARKFIEMIDSGMPLEEAQKLTSKALSVKDFNEQNLSSNKDLQKKAIESYLKTLDMSDEDIKDQLEYFEDTDKLYEKSVSFSNKLKDYYAQEEEFKINQLKEQEELNKKNIEDQINGLKDTVYKTSEIIPGRPLNDKIKDKLFQSITTPAGKDPNTGQPLNRVALKRLEDPVSFEIKLHYLNELGVFDDKWDGIISAGKTQAVKEFEKALSSTKGPSGNTPVYSPDDSGEKTKSIVDSFKQLKQQLNKSNI